MATTTTQSSDSGVDVHSSRTDEPLLRASTEKEVAISHEKQVFSRGDDSAKEVVSPTFETQPTSIADADTMKQAMPNHPPISMDKEVAAPLNDGDKELAISPSLSRSDTTAANLSRSNALLVLRVEKYNPLGLILPMDQKLSLCGLDPLTNRDLGPMFVTGDMSWVDVVSVLPPMFELFRCQQGQRGGMEMVFCARSVPQGWQGISGVKVDIEAEILEHSTTSSDGGPQTSIQRWHIDRRGMGRNYKLTRTDSTGTAAAEYVWKGTSSTIKDMLVSQPTQDGSKKEKLHKGNFKLVPKDGGDLVLAVWQQARGNDLGFLTIFNEARGKVPVEVIVTTSLTAVSAERASGINWFGGIGK